MSTADALNVDPKGAAKAGADDGHVSNDDDDDVDDLTDESCLEVPMMDYYKIRHQVSSSHSFSIALTLSLSFSLTLKVLSLSFTVSQGRGGSASGRAMAFCPSGPGANPGTNFGFFGSDCHSILAGCWAFSVNEVIDQRMSDTSILLSFFLS